LVGLRPCRVGLDRGLLCRRETRVLNSKVRTLRRCN
jgi:hypothetical protein